MSYTPILDIEAEGSIKINSSNGSDIEDTNIEEPVTDTPETELEEETVSEDKKLEDDIDSNIKDSEATMKALFRSYSAYQRLSQLSTINTHSKDLQMFLVEGMNFQALEKLRMEALALPAGNDNTPAPINNEIAQATNQQKSKIKAFLQAIIKFIQNLLQKFSSFISKLKPIYTFIVNQIKKFNVDLDLDILNKTEMGNKLVHSLKVSDCDNLIDILKKVCELASKLNKMDASEEEVYDVENQLQAIESDAKSTTENKKTLDVETSWHKNANVVEIGNMILESFNLKTSLDATAKKLTVKIKAFSENPPTDGNQLAVISKQKMIIDKIVKLLAFLHDTIFPVLKMLKNLFNIQVKAENDPSLTSGKAIGNQNTAIESFDSIIDSYFLKKSELAPGEEGFIDNIKNSLTTIIERIKKSFQSFDQRIATLQGQNYNLFKQIKPSDIDDSPLSFFRKEMFQGSLGLGEYINNGVEQIAKDLTTLMESNDNVISIRNKYDNDIQKVASIFGCAPSLLITKPIFFKQSFKDDMIKKVCNRNIINVPPSQSGYTPDYIQKSLIPIAKLKDSCYALANKNYASEAKTDNGLVHYLTIILTGCFFGSAAVGKVISFLLNDLLRGVSKEQRLAANTILVFFSNTATVCGSVANLSLSQFEALIERYNKAAKALQKQETTKSTESLYWMMDSDLDFDTSFTNITAAQESFMESLKSKINNAFKSYSKIIAQMESADFTTYSRIPMTAIDKQGTLKFFPKKVFESALSTINSVESIANEMATDLETIVSNNNVSYNRSLIDKYNNITSKILSSFNAKGDIRNEKYVKTIIANSIDEAIPSKMGYSIHDIESSLGKLKELSRKLESIKSINADKASNKHNSLVEWLVAYLIFSIPIPLTFIFSLVYLSNHDYRYHISKTQRQMADRITTQMRMIFTILNNVVKVQTETFGIMLNRYGKISKAGSEDINTTKNMDLFGEHANAILY